MRKVVMVCAAGFGLGCAAPTSAAAFWERSQVSRCADAQTQAELLRFRCAELGAYADPGWPDFWLLSRERIRLDRQDYRHGPPPEPGLVPRAPVRRLG